MIPTRTGGIRSSFQYHTIVFPRWTAFPPFPSLPFYIYRGFEEQKEHQADRTERQPTQSPSRFSGTIFFFFFQPLNPQGWVAAAVDLQLRELAPSKIFCKWAYTFCAKATYSPVVLTFRKTPPPKEVVHTPPRGAKILTRVRRAERATAIRVPEIGSTVKYPDPSNH